MNHTTDETPLLDTYGDDGDEDVFNAAKRVVAAARAGHAADVVDQINAAMLLMFVAEALSATLTPAALESFTNIDEIRIGFDGALAAMSHSTGQLADAAEARSDLCRRPNLRPDSAEDRQFPRDLIEGWRVASNGERRTLAAQSAARLRTAAHAMADARAVLREVPFARYFPPDGPVSDRLATRRAKRFEDAFATVPEQRPAPLLTMTALYRWYDEDGQLLYVGITGQLAGRQNGHSKKSSWSEFAATSTVERFRTRDEALAAERAAIEAEQPLFNGTHNDSPEAKARLVTYLVKHDRLDLLVPSVARA